MVFCVLVFFIEICVKKFQPIIRTTLYTIFLRVSGFWNWNYREKNQKLPKETGKNSVSFMLSHHEE